MDFKNIIKKSSSEPQDINIPTGGFPPLFICNIASNVKLKKPEDITRREAVAKQNKLLVPISSILQKRREENKIDTTNFVPL